MLPPTSEAGGGGGGEGGGTVGWDDGGFTVTLAHRTDKTSTHTAAWTSYYDCSNPHTRWMLLLIAPAVLLIAAVTLFFPLAALLDPLTIHLSFRSPSLLWAASAAQSWQPPSLANSNNVEPSDVRRSTDQLNVAMNALYHSATTTTPLPDLSASTSALSSLLSLSEPSAASRLLRCLDAAASPSTSTSPAPSLSTSSKHSSSSGGCVVR